jgi:hypothetical protein
VKRGKQLFGDSDAKLPRVAAPVGLRCFSCHKPFLATDKGVIFERHHACFASHVACFANAAVSDFLDAYCSLKV